MKLNASTIPTFSAEQIINGISTGEAIIEKAVPVISSLFNIIKGWIENAGGDGLSSPHGKKIHIQAIEAREVLQKTLNSMYNENWLQQDIFNKHVATLLNTQAPALHFVDNTAPVDPIVTTG